MLTNVHTIVLKRLLGDAASEDALDLYAYNLAPDALPMHPSISPSITHQVNFTPEAMALFPKLFYVKLHLLVDNLGHYDQLVKPKSLDGNSGKQGYGYQKGVLFTQEVQGLMTEVGKAISPQQALYGAHVLVEMALDLRVFDEAKELPSLLHQIEEGISEEQWRQYSLALGWLYHLSPEVVNEARKAPRKFYEPFGDYRNKYFHGRARLFMRKFKLPAEPPVIQKVESLFLQVGEALGDFLPHTLPTWVAKLRAEGDMSHLRELSSEE